MVVAMVVEVVGSWCLEVVLVRCGMQKGERGRTKYLSNGRKKMVGGVRRYEGRKEQRLSEWSRREHSTQVPPFC